MRLIPFEPSHVSWLEKPYGSATEEMRNPLVDWKEWSKKHVDDGGAYTAIDELGRIIACGGIMELWQHHGDAWFYGTHLLPKNAKSIIKVTRKTIDLIAKHKEYKRVSTHVLTDWKEAVRFIEYLGFKREGFHQKYGPNETDYYTYAKIYKEL